jgi:hypothetical protein
MHYLGWSGISHETGNAPQQGTQQRFIRISWNWYDESGLEGISKVWTMVFEGDFAFWLHQDDADTMGITVQDARRLIRPIATTRLLRNHETDHPDVVGCSFHKSALQNGFESRAQRTFIFRDCEERRSHDFKMIA